VLVSEAGQRPPSCPFHGDGQTHVPGIAVAVGGSGKLGELVDRGQRVEDAGGGAVEPRAVQVVEVDTLGQAAGVRDQVAQAHGDRPRGKLGDPLRQGGVEVEPARPDE
jgi:hypothetical protein